MTKKPPQNRKKTNPITTNDVGLYLKQLAALHMNARTGNPDLGRALLEIATKLIHKNDISKNKINPQTQIKKAQNLTKTSETKNLPLVSVKQILNEDKSSKTELVAIGTNRFGIAKSRIDKLPREEIITTILAAIRHEESLMIISDEAKRGGQSRSS